MITLKDIETNDIPKEVLEELSNNKGNEEEGN